MLSVYGSFFLSKLWLVYYLIWLIQHMFCSCGIFFLFVCFVGFLKVFSGALFVPYLMMSLSSSKSSPLPSFSLLSHTHTYGSDNCIFRHNQRILFSFIFISQNTSKCGSILQSINPSLPSTCNWMKLLKCTEDQFQLGGS